MPDFVGRLVVGAVAVVLLNDAIRWDHSWVYNGRFLGGWIRRESRNAQIVFRMTLGVIGGLGLLGALFGTAIGH